MNYKQEFIKLFTEHIKRDGASELLRYLEATDFFTAPASTRHHESYEGGLVEHSVKVYYELYNEAYHLIEDGTYSMETIAIVSLLHDLCKVNFYKVDYRNTKDEHGKWVKVPYYTVDDQMPLGHSEKSILLIREMMQLSLDEMYAINAHMGGFDSRQQLIGQMFSKSQLAVHLHCADLKATYLK